MSDQALLLFSHLMYNIVWCYITSQYCFTD